MKYSCTDCGFITVNKKDYSRHLLTAKHQMIINGNKKTHYDHQCGCGKQFKFMSGLCRHQKSCTYVSVDVGTTSDRMINTETVVELLRQNQQFKSFMIEQAKQMQDTQDKNTELQQQLIAVVREGKNITHTTTNNNQKFNLNFFLNTTCKDAINMTEFIQNMQIRMSELENIGHNGYVDGMTELILNKLKDLDVSKRPVHCTDIKRETMYIKDHNKWDKDTTNKSKLRDAISHVSKKNYGKIIEWRERNPECMEIGSNKYDFCFNMMRNVLGDFEDEQIKLDNKVIKNIAKEVIVDR